MKFSRIDFARHRPLPGWYLPAFAACLALCLWGGYRYLHVGGIAGEARAALLMQRQTDERRAAAAVVPAVALPREQLKSINDAIAALNLPWPALLGAIEAVQPRDVALVRIEPRTKDRAVLITAQADDMGRLVDYMGQISRTAPFVKVSPTRQEVVLEGDRLRKQASFEAFWEDHP
jgi:hypothetical protein